MCAQKRNWCVLSSTFYSKKSKLPQGIKEMEVIQLTQPARRRLFLKKKSSKLHFESLYIVGGGGGYKNMARILASGWVFLCWCEVTNRHFIEAESETKKCILLWVSSEPFQIAGGKINNLHTRDHLRITEMKLRIKFGRLFAERYAAISNTFGTSLAIHQSAFNRSGLGGFVFFVVVHSMTIIAALSWISFLCLRTSKC